MNTVACNACYFMIDCMHAAKIIYTRLIASYIGRCDILKLTMPKTECSSYNGMNFTYQTQKHRVLLVEMP